MLFRFEIYAHIETDNVLEAEKMYVAGDFVIDSHSIYLLADNGDEIEMEVPSVE